MIRSVLDTNILVSALLSPLGNEALVVEAVQQGNVVPCFSAEILDEYAEVLSRPKFRFSKDAIKGILGLIRTKGLLFSSEPVVRVSPDPEDDALIACAIAAGAEFLVTGNKRHFPQESYGRSKVVSARELLEILKKPECR
jgi:uncharacterized protein